MSPRPGVVPVVGTRLRDDEIARDAIGVAARNGLTTSRAEGVRVDVEMAVSVARRMGCSDPEAAVARALASRPPSAIVGGGR